MVARHTPVPLLEALLRWRESESPKGAHDASTFQRKLAVECIFCSACIRFVECCPMEGHTEKLWSGLENFVFDWLIKADSFVQQKVTHTTGSKSFARVGDEMASEDGAKVGRIPLYVTTHTRKDGSYLHPKIEDIIEKANAKKNEKAATPSQDAKEDIEIMAEVFGPQCNGRVKG